jgi:hypothetical protein
MPEPYLLAPIDYKAYLASSFSRRTFQKERAMGSYHSLTPIAALSNRRLKRRVAFLVGILLAISLR